MQNFDIAISGLSVAQKALNVIGNNVANAATEGYHRQEINLLPSYSSQVGGTVLGGGVEMAGVTRVIDRLLEQELLRQKSSLGYVSQELTTLETVENAFGEFAAGSSLSVVLDDFFNALQDLCAHPTDAIYQNQTITAGQALAGQFRTLGEFLAGLETQVALEAENAVDKINTLIGQIARLNDDIKAIEIRAGDANNLRDQRDRCITELAESIGVETVSREHGVVDVTVAGISVVTGAVATELEVGLNEDGYLGILPAGAYSYVTSVQQGRLGALLSLKNSTLTDIHSDLDALANAVIQQVNGLHVQGVGSAGSFTELTGWAVASQDLSDFEPPLTDGKVCIRVTNTTTGQIERHEIEVDVSDDSLTSVAADISAITGLAASVVSSKLQIRADAGYRFDFLPAVLSEPAASNLTAATPPSVSVSGIYTGQENDTFCFKVLDSGAVGNGNLRLEVKNESGDVVEILNVGAGYAAGDVLELDNGIEISLSMGDLIANGTFEAAAFADTDTSGLLAAAGINTFFSGDAATTMAVCEEILNSPSRMATALGPEMNDNSNAQQLAELADQTIGTLNDMTPGQFYSRLVTNLGQDISIKQMRQGNVENMVQNLADRQGEMSGVNINDEAARILVYEQMFQAMAKYLTTIQSSMLSLMEIV